ncbi:uncharacterized protein IWZ02DRAFT_444190 [Phyllosticta citriasiana]|uniref:Secreted protein n=1 Tax=Phyllosticta citriasiana TaxID=595635 RepID=A0ABR1KH56_9PEZI
MSTPFIVPPLSLSLFFCSSSHVDSRSVQNGLLHQVPSSSDQRLQTGKGREDGKSLSKRRHSLRDSTIDWKYECCLP